MKARGPKIEEVKDAQWPPAPRAPEAPPPAPKVMSPVGAVVWFLVVAFVVTDFHWVAMNAINTGMIPINLTNTAERVRFAVALVIVDRGIPPLVTGVWVATFWRNGNMTVKQRLGRALVGLPFAAFIWSVGSGDSVPFYLVFTLLGLTLTGFVLDRIDARRRARAPAVNGP